MKPYCEHGGITIYHGDCREVLPQVEADVLVTDPPYGTGCAPRGGRHAGTLDLGSAQHPAWDVWSADWLLPWSGPAAVFCGIARTFDLGSALRADGLLVYVKSNPSPFGSSWEPIVTRGFKRTGQEHFVAYNAFNGQRHPTQKPLDLMRWLVNRAPTGAVVDPFMGSGTTLVAAKDLGRRAIGIELEERYCEIAANRLRQEVLPLEVAM